MRSVHKLGQISAGQVLRADGLLDEEQLEGILEEHRATHERITDIARSRGLVTEFDVARAMSHHLQLPYVKPGSYDIPEGIKEILSPSLLHGHRLVPLDRFGTILVLATCGDIDPAILGHIETETRCKVALFIAQSSEIESVLNEQFPLESLGAEVVSRLDELFGG